MLETFSVVVRKMFMPSTNFILLSSISTHQIIEQLLRSHLMSYMLADCNPKPHVALTPATYLTCVISSPHYFLY